MIEDILNFLTNNKNAFTSFGILATFMVSVVSLLFSIRNNKAVHYVNSITKSRIEWIQNVRKNVSEFIAKTNVYENAYYKKDYIKSGEHLSECKKIATELKLLLNCCDKEDKEICKITDRILNKHREYCDRAHNMTVDKNGYFIESQDDKKLKKSIQKDIEELIKKVHIYLKLEWNRVKFESQGKRYTKKKIDKHRQKLEKQYKCD